MMKLVLLFDQMTDYVSLLGASIRWILITEQSVSTEGDILRLTEPVVKQVEKPSINFHLNGAWRQRAESNNGSVHRRPILK